MPTHATTQMNLENTMLQNTKGYLRFHLHEVLRIGKFIETESTLEATRDLRQAGWALFNHTHTARQSFSRLCTKTKYQYC